MMILMIRLKVMRIIKQNNLFIHIMESQFIELIKEGNLTKIQEFYNNSNIDIFADNNRAFDLACGRKYIDVAEWLLTIILQKSKSNNFDFSCGKCMDVWNCIICKNGYCDDFYSPTAFTGKPEKHIYNNSSKEELISHFGKKYGKKLLLKKLEEPPEPRRFFLCRMCLNKYEERNICKGQIGRAHV